MGTLLLLFLLLVLLLMAAYAFGMRQATARFQAAEAEAPPVIPPEALNEWQSRLAPMLAITGHRAVIEFTGRLKGKADEMFRRIREAFAGEPVTPLLLEGEREDVRVLVLPETKAAAQERPRWLLHWSLFLATLVTTTWAGALHAGVNLLQQPERFTVGLPYSIGLLLILGAHELGHYFTARKNGINVTPPFFIPVPFALGTFGAFIRIKSLTPNRQALFDVAVAGPLAGLLFAVPALLVGLQFSEVRSSESSGMLAQPGVNVGSSILLSGLAWLSLGDSVLYGYKLLLHPLAFAGWLGLIVTALNLLPIGQLDGGHMAHALFGSRRARTIGTVTMALLFLVALLIWPGLLFWALIVFFLAGTGDAPAANDLTPVDPRRKALGYFTFLLLLLIVVPVPHSIYDAITARLPYL